MKRGMIMGKDLSGKELGKGIVQRKDGRYFARYTSPDGKRTGKYFSSAAECKEWLNAKNKTLLTSKITVDNWFKHWIKNIKKNTVRKNTLKNYTDRYMQNIKSEIGSLELREVKPLHCQKVLNKMLDENYAGSTMEQTRITMFNMFYSAEENEIILSNPVKRSVKLPRKPEKNPRVLTLEEQNKFLEVAKNTSNYYQYLFLLNTGLRAGELIGLKWSDIDFENRQISINRSVSYDIETKTYVEGEPKSEHSYRKIPMTNQVYEILRIKYSNKHVFADSEFADFVFLNRNGEPTKNSSYDSHIRKLAEKANIDSFSMHTFRHTFATRCIEAGLKPKTVQQLLGHSSINITMNLYVHVTDDEKRNEMFKFESTIQIPQTNL